LEQDQVKRNKKSRDGRRIDNLTIVRVDWGKRVEKRVNITNRRHRSTLYAKWVGSIGGSIKQAK